MSEEYIEKVKRMIGYLQGFGTEKYAVAEVGVQDVKEALEKLLALQSELDTLKQAVKDAVGDMHKYCLRPSYVAGDALTLVGIENILHKHGLIEEDK